MKKEYDFVFLTNLPAFYKINLWNKMSITKKILVIYTGQTAEERNADFFSVPPKFDSIFLSGSKLHQLWQFLKLICTTKYNRLYVGGWDHITSIFAVFLSPLRKNGCIVESSVYESNVTGLKAIIKKLYLRRIHCVYATGLAQKKLVEVLGFKGKIVLTGGCGLLNYLPQPHFVSRNDVRKFLYVGRLAKVKNLELLIEAFNRLPQLELGIIGFGPMEQSLKKIAHKNITFLGSVPNKELSKYYAEYDVFVLPSASEAWGLVVEEALNNGTPVIVSDRVGCKDDLVTNETGLVFKWNSIEDLTEKITKVLDTEFYNRLRRGVSQINFMKRADHQVKVFLGENEVSD